MTSRKRIKEGTLLKAALNPLKKKYNPRYFYCRDGFLLYYEKQPQPGVFNFHPKGVVPLGEASVKEDPNQENGFIISHPDFQKKSLRLKAPTKQQMAEWVAYLQEMTKVHGGAIQKYESEREALLHSVEQDKQRLQAQADADKQETLKATQENSARQKAEVASKLSEVERQRQEELKRMEQEREQELKRMEQEREERARQLAAELKQLEAQAKAAVERAEQVATERVDREKELRVMAEASLKDAEKSLRRLDIALRANKSGSTSMEEINAAVTDITGFFESVASQMKLEAQKEDLMVEALSARKKYEKTAATKRQQILELEADEDAKREARLASVQLSSNAEATVSAGQLEEEDSGSEEDDSSAEESDNDE